MKNYFGAFIFGFVLLAAGMASAQQTAFAEFQSRGTNRVKICFPGFTNGCTFTGVYKVEDISYSWTETWVYHNVDTNGAYYEATRQVFSASADTTVNCSGITNASGSATYTDAETDGDRNTTTTSASATMVLTNGAAIFVDTSDPPAPSWPTNMFIDPNTGEAISMDDPNPPVPADPPTWTLTHPSKSTEVLTVKGRFDEDPVTGDYVEIDFTKTTSLSEEYTMDDLLAGFDDDPNSTWQPGLGEAAVAIDAGQTIASMVGARARFGMIGPKGNFKIPYVITAHFDDPATNICSTNYIVGKGDGITAQYYPCGKGIQLHPPFGKVGSGDCAVYVGGTASIDLLGFCSLLDYRDKPTCEKCETCRDDNGNPISRQDDGPITPTDEGTVGMPRWRVSEPYLNLWVGDTPVEYTTSRGEKIGFTMNYRQHDTRPRTFNGQPCFVPVTGWNHNWFSYVHFSGATLFDTNGAPIGVDYTNWTATVYNAGGGESDFTARQGPEARDGDQLLSLNGVDSEANAHGFRLVHSDGSQDIYSLITPSYPTCYTDSVPAVLDPIDSPSATVLTNRPPYPSTLFEVNFTASYSGYQPAEVFESGGAGDGRFFPDPTHPIPWELLVCDSVVTNCLAVEHVNESADALLTYHIDPYGNATHLAYSNSPSGQYFLQSITDYDNNVTTISYTNGCIAQVKMPYNRTASFQYTGGTNAFLTRVTDAQGMTTTFTYSSDDGVNNSVTGDMTSMITPYGTNSFSYFDADKDSISKTNNGVTRSIFITNPDGSHEVYAYYNDATNSAPFSYSPSEVPDFEGLDVGDSENSQSAMYLRNSFYWGRSQSAALTLTNADADTMNALGTNAFLLARMRHWMLESDNSSISSAYSMQQEPSPDDVTPGQRTWFVYPTVTGNAWVLATGFPQQPVNIARLQPDGTTWSKTISYDGYGNPLTMTTYSVAPDSSPVTTTESYSFFTEEYSVDAGTGPITWDAARFFGYSGPNGSASYSYDLAPLTNSVGGYPVIYPNFSTLYVTRGDTFTQLFFNSREQVSGGILPNGITVTNVYGVDGFLSKSIAIETPSTNTYTFSSGMPATWTDPRGLTRTFSWDNLDRLTTITFPDSTTVVNTYTNLNLASQKDRLNHSWTAHYDNMGRRTLFTDRNGNTTSFSYCGCGSLDSIIDPQTNSVIYGRDYANRITSATYNSTFVRNFTRDSLGRIVYETNNLQQSFNYIYDNLNRLLQVTSPQGTVFAATYDAYNLPTIVQNAEGILTTNLWDDSGRHLLYQYYANGMYHNWNYANGLLSSEYDGVHSTSYGRDKAGHLTSVQDANNHDTYFTYSPGGDLIGMTNANNAVTLWDFDIYGRMIHKTDANNVLVETNGYDVDNRLTKHWTPAKGLTQYGYDNNGNTLSVAYSSGPGITATYDTLNRIATMTDAVGNSKFTYQNFGPFWSALASEDGPWLADTMSRTYYANGLPNTYALDGGWSGSYGYDAMLRLHTLSSPAGTFTYNYANTTGGQIASLGLPGSPTIAYGYDTAGLLTSTALKDSGNHVLDSYDYTYDAVGWRTNVLRADGTHVGYGYDSIGQLTSAQGFESGGTPRFNENFGYTYDPAGNLTQRVNDTLSQTFAVDPANELMNVLRTTTVMTVAGGLTNSPTSLSINGKTANIYADKTFAATNVALLNGLNTFTNILTISSTSYTNQLTKNLPLSANFSYDLNGNMTGDGLRGFEYDCANQLTRITLTNKFKSEFVYDGFGRRRISREYAWTGTWVPTSETHYVYDGMLVIQERDGNNATQVSYTRGLDLSGSQQGAGGIGGLLARTDASGSAYYHADGMGNVTAMINSSGAVLAKYLYDPYGNLVDKSGTLADANPYRFSSKEMHVATGLYYFGFRYYEPNLQRWLNRDLIQEGGGFNLYAFVNNSSVNLVDPVGLQEEMEKDGEGGGWRPDIFKTPEELEREREIPIGLGYPAEPTMGSSGEGKSSPNDLAEPPDIDLEDVCLSEALRRNRQRTPEENRRARQTWKNNKDSSKRAWEDREGKLWPKDKNGRDWPGHHNPYLKNGGHPLEDIEPQDPNGADPHNIPGPDGLTDYQRWGKLGPIARMRIYPLP